MLADGLATIAARDSAFTESLFLDRARKGFLVTQDAWSEQDLSPCRPFLSDGVHERFKLYIAMQQAENLRNRLRDVHIRDAVVVAVTNDAHFDTIHVRFTAQAISYDEDLTTGRRVGGHSQREPIVFREIWSFSRRTGVATQAEAALMEGNCPNCGGGLAIVDVARCPHCDSQVNSGQYDWVLAEITQAEEWVVPPVEHAVTGWPELVRRDPSLNFQHLEDRASVMFWRCMMAVYFEDPGYAVPVMARGRDELPELWRLRSGQFWRMPAVGTVEVTRCRGASGDDAHDRIYVLVRWSGRRAEGDRRRPRELDLQRVYSHVLVLRRRAGVTSNIDFAFASFNCHNCGAPVAIGTDAVCNYCETTLNDGAWDWVLEDVEPFSPVLGYQREDWRDAAANLGPGVERLEEDRFVNEPELLVALARMVTVDGLLHDSERQYLAQLAKRRGVSASRLNAILSSVEDSEQPVLLPRNEREAATFVDHLVRAALVDGYITRRERALLVRAADSIGWGETQLNAAIDLSREQLYRQAKKILKRRRD